MSSHRRRLSDAPPPYDVVVFDCDSTLSAMEGIEELVGENAEIAALTSAAMDGSVPLEEVYGKRLEIARPTAADMERIGALYIDHAIPHARALVTALRSLGKRVAIISGGLLPPVRAFGEWLGVDVDHIEAVAISFGRDGSYAGFDTSSPLARAGGKIEVLQRFVGAGESLAFVGDGATDLEAAHLSSRFIAYGGVERREAVAAAAHVTCDEADFRYLVPLLLSPHEIGCLAEDAAHRTLLGAVHPPSH